MGVLAASTKFLASARAARAHHAMADLGEEDGSLSSTAAAERLRDSYQTRVPEIRRLVDPDQLNFMVQVRKTNNVGKVQTRLLVITDAAVYNVDATAAMRSNKVKRTIALSDVSLVTASEHTGQFILHVPCLLYTSPSPRDS